VSWNLPENWNSILLVIFIVMGVGLLFSLALTVWVFLRVRRIRLPADAGFVTAMRATPFVVVLLLDLLDFSLDFLAAPFAWTLLGYLGLKPLRGASVLESLIPGTQFIPTMTLAWILARLAANRE